MARQSQCDAKNYNGTRAQKSLRDPRHSTNRVNSCSTSSRRTNPPRKHRSPTDVSFPRPMSTTLENSTGHLDTWKFLANTSRKRDSSMSPWKCPCQRTAVLGLAKMQRPSKSRIADRWVSLGSATAMSIQRVRWTTDASGYGSHESRSQCPRSNRLSSDPKLESREFLLGVHCPQRRPLILTIHRLFGDCFE
jgi:hypothetical protein